MQACTEKAKVIITQKYLLRELTTLPCQTCSAIPTQASSPEVRMLYALCRLLCKDIFQNAKRWQMLGNRNFLWSGRKWYWQTAQIRHMKPLTNENLEKLYQLTNEKRENLREMTRQVLQKGSFKYQKIGLKLLGKIHKALEYFCKKKKWTCLCMYYEIQT